MEQWRRREKPQDIHVIEDSNPQRDGARAKMEIVKEVLRCY